MAKKSTDIIEKVTSYRATSPDGKMVANGKTPKEARALLALMMAQ